MQLVVATGELQRRYRDQTASLEDRIGLAQSRVETARADAEQASGELRRFVRALSF